MESKKSQKPVEGVIIEEITDTGRRSGAGLFFGTVLLVWGGSILLDTYLGTDLGSNIWPLLAVVFGVYLVVSSFKR